MFFQACLLSVLALAAANPLGKQTNSDLRAGRIAGGSEVQIEDVPYQVLLQLPDGKICGGSILSAEWILTAAGCLKTSADEITVRAGSATRSSGGITYSINRVIRHENYTVDSYSIPNNDIGLVKLNTKLAIDNTRRPISLYKKNQQIPAGTPAAATGWGSTSSQSMVDSANLRKVELNIVSKDTCQEKYSDVKGIRPNQICAGYSGRGQCHGDEGGPLVVNDLLAGILSWNQGCTTGQYPAVSTEVAAYIDWIAKTTGL